MKKITTAATLLVTCLLLAETRAGVSLTNFNTTAATNLQFDLGSFARADINTLPISPSQQGGSYRVNGGVNGLGVVASGSAATPSFSLTITNNTASAFSSIHLVGKVFQLKGNSGGISETLSASVSGISLADESILDATTVVDATGINNPAATKPYDVLLNGFVLNPGQSFTITWTDANDAGTDAFFGLSDMSVQAAAVPEPGTLALLGLGISAGLWRLRRKSASR
jgi:hypothetical protein